MALLERVVKPKTQRGKRALLKREPKLVENIKTALFVRGLTASDKVQKLLKDFSALKKPNGIFFGRKNDILPFEDVTPLEFFSQKNDASLIMFGSHNKKRPHNVIIGRTFDYHMFDMVEFGIEQFKSMAEFKGPKIALGTKPCVVFTGEIFDTDPQYQRIMNLLLDFFRGPEVPAVRLAGLEHVISFTCNAGKIFMRSYRTMLKKSGTKTPRIELEEIGPSVDLVIRRSNLASNDLFKQATRKPLQLKPKKVKNINKDAFGSKMGRIHMQKQNLDKLQNRKLKGLRKSPAERNLEKRERKARGQKRPFLASGGNAERVSKKRKL